MNKFVVMGVLLLVLSSFVAAEEDSCAGFFGTLNCLLWGDPQVRSSLAGEAYSRNLVGGATGIGELSDVETKLGYTTSATAVYKDQKGIVTYIKDNSGGGIDYLNSENKWVKSNLDFKDVADFKTKNPSSFFSYTLPPSPSAPPVAAASSGSSSSGGAGKSLKKSASAPRVGASSGSLKAVEQIKKGLTKVNCNGKDCYVDEKGDMFSDGQGSNKMEGLKYKKGKDEETGSFKLETGYSWAKPGEKGIDSLAVQQDQKETKVEYIDNNGDLIQLKEEGGSVKKWDQSANSGKGGWVAYPDSSSKNLKGFVQDKLKSGDTGFEDVNKGKVVQVVKQEYAQSVLGDVYEEYKNKIDVDKVVMKTDDANNKKFELKNGLGSIEKVDKDDTIFSTLTVTIKKDDGTDFTASKTVLVKDGRSIAFQTEEGKSKGEMMLYRGESEAKVYTLKDSKKGLDDLKTGEELVFTDGVGDAKQNIASVQLNGNMYTFTDFKAETQTVRDMKTGELTQWESGDYYTSGTKKGDCSGKENCFIPSKGKIYDKNKNLIYLADADTTGTFSDQKLEKVELFNPKSGRYEGVQYPDGSKIEAVKGSDGKYTGDFTKTSADGTITNLKKDCLSCSPAEKEAVAGLYSGTQGTNANIQSSLESIYAIENSIKSYPALNKLIFKDIGGADWAENWQKKADETFAPMLGSNWFPSAICETESRMKDIVPSGKAMIKTSSGTYQTVASIQGEKSEKKAAILCSRNPDKEAKEEWVCGAEQMCGQDQLCYADKNEDGEADIPSKGEVKPVEGYFYTISWAVTAPSDEKLTPLMKSGAAVSFNVEVRDDKNNKVQLYRGKNGETADAIQLANGAHDRDVITHYSEKVLTDVCIVWKNAPGTVEGGFPKSNVIEAGKEISTLGFSNLGGGSTLQPLQNVCTTIILSEKGIVNWESSNKVEFTSSTTVSAGKVEKVRNW